MYLQEKERIQAELKTLLDTELQVGVSGLVLADLTAKVVDAMTLVPRAIVPDMPDRIIAATALSLGLPLLSRDRVMAKVEGLDVIW